LVLAKCISFITVITIYIYIVVGDLFVTECFRCCRMCELLTLNNARAHYTQELHLFFYSEGKKPSKYVHVHSLTSGPRAENRNRPTPYSPLTRRHRSASIHALLLPLAIPRRRRRFHHPGCRPSAAVAAAVAVEGRARTTPPPR
jgi:hypothetical protein